MRPVPLFLAIVLVLIAAFALATALGWNDDAAKLRKLGDVEVLIPDAERWWTRTAACLGDPKPFNPKTRWFVGAAIPPRWMAQVDQHRTFAGYTSPSQALVVLSSPTDSAIVVHEEWHVLHGGGHPDQIFAPPRCGLAAP